MSRPSAALRAAPLVALVLLGFAIVVALDIARPGPRLSRKARLVDLIREEDERARELRLRLDELHAGLDRLEAQAARSGRRLRVLRGRLGELETLGGLIPVAGPGVRVELRDSRLRESPSGNLNDLVIHEQDLQAIVNGLWAAGAEAIAINGERITALSAVRCVGNTLLLHGSVYSPPYRIEAIGDPERLLAGLTADPLVERFRVLAGEFRLGFDVSSARRLSLPAFRGIVAARFADPLGG